MVARARRMCIYVRPYLQHPLACARRSARGAGGICAPYERHGPQRNLTEVSAGGAALESPTRAS